MMTFKIRKDRRGKWRWALLAGNNKIMADSGEGYANLRNVRRAIETIRSAMHWSGKITIDVCRSSSKK